MMFSIYEPFPTPVNVMRIPRGPSDLNGKIEKIRGYLVDESGNDLDTPKVGIPICLGGEVREKKPLFKSAGKVVQIDTSGEDDYDWIVLTDDGHLYIIENDRLMM